MANDYSKLAESIVTCIGGKENVNSVMHCMTRLRFQVKDETKVDQTGIQKIDGVLQLIIASGQYQVVIGTHVADVCKAVENVLGKTVNSDKPQEEISDTKQKKKEGPNILLTCSLIRYPEFSCR